MHEHVLVVEDDIDLSEAMQMILEFHGYQVAVANNGLEALRAVDDHMPSLIILDMKMPIMDGWAFAREFARLYNHAAPILVVTAAENPRDRADEIGAAAVLPKPFDLKVLIAEVQRLTSHAHEQARSSAQT